jgi:hypothetical protein
MNVSNAKSTSVQSTQKATDLQKTAQANAQTQRRQEQVQLAQAQQQRQQQVKPVMNTQGQMTGRLVNVSA